jgi:hypothetical protein
MDDSRILDVWAAGRRHPAARSQLMLAAAYPGIESADLCGLPVGRRNVLLLQDRRVTVGDRADVAVDCPGCGEQLELELAPTELIRAADPGADGFLCAELAPGAVSPDSNFPTDQPAELRVGDVVVRFRLPAVDDLDAAASGADADDAAGMLMRRCVLSARRAGQLVAVADLPAEVLAAIDESFARLDPHAVLRVSTSCSGCGLAFEASLDPGLLYWAELAQRAQRLLSEVHRLASAYGWSEAEILGLDPDRREGYLELVG